MPRKRLSSAPPDWYTPEMREADAALVGVRWRCRLHGVIPLGAEHALSGYAYCPDGDCPERLILVSRVKSLFFGNPERWNTLDCTQDRKTGS
jgi:hypothetical protein